MSIGMFKLTVLAVVIVATASLMVGVNANIEQGVKAQNMTTNMTGGNTTGTEDGSGSISGLNVDTGPTQTADNPSEPDSNWDYSPP